MLKKFLLFTAISLAIFSVNDVFATRTNRNVQYLNKNNNGVFEKREVNPHQEYKCGPAKCAPPKTYFKKRTYCTKRCVKEPYTVRKKHTRYVSRYYTRKHCRYVPQYYTKTYCRQIPECYYTCETKYRTKVVTDQRCCYEPCTQCQTSYEDISKRLERDQNEYASANVNSQSASREHADFQETPISGIQNPRYR